MVLFNHSTRELTAKIVYYGPGLCGKTTNLRVLHERLEKGNVGRLLSLSTAQDRTIYFDLLPVELGNIKGYTVRFQLCTVPGQVFYNETRKLVLRGVDGIVFVVDSQWSMLSHNLESFQNLRENMREAEMDLDAVPVVIQYNKRDLPGVLSVGGLQESLNFQSFPYVEAVANEGKGVVETFKLISRLTFVELLKRLQKSGGLEGESLAAVDGAHDESLVRALSRADRRSPEPEPEPEPETPFTDSPFETTGSWPAPATGEVFGEMTGARRRTVAPGPATPFSTPAASFAPASPASTVAIVAPPIVPAPAASTALPVDPVVSAGPVSAEPDHGPFSVAIPVPRPTPPDSLSLDPFAATRPARQSVQAPPAVREPEPVPRPLEAVLEPPPPPPAPAPPPLPAAVLETPPPPPPPEPRATLADVEELRRGLQSLAEIAAPFADGVITLRNDLDALKDRVDDLAADFDGTASSGESLRKELAELTGQVHELRDRQPVTASALTALRETVAALEARAGTAEARVSDVVADAEDVKGGIRQLAARIESLAGTVESGRAATEHLGARVTELGASALTGAALDALRAEVTGLVAPVRHEVSVVRGALEAEAHRHEGALTALREESAGALARLGADLDSRRGGDAAALDELRQRLERELASVSALAAEGRDGVARLDTLLREAREELRSHREEQESRTSQLAGSFESYRAEAAESDRHRDEGLIPLLGALETFGADRARHDAEAAELARRLAGFEEELARQRDLVAETRRAADERIAAAEGRVRKLADSLRQALAALGE